MIKTLAYFIVLALVFALGYWFCQKTLEPEVNIRTETDTIRGDTIVQVDTLEKPIPKHIYRDTGSTDTLVQYKDVDTIQILSDYFSKVIYSDTLKNDSSAFISLSDTIYMNRIHRRRLRFKNRRETEIIHNHYHQQNGIYIGGKIGLGVSGVDLMYLNDKNMYGIGVDALMLDEPKYFFNLKYKRLLWKKQ